MYACCLTELKSGWCYAGFLLLLLLFYGFTFHLLQ